MKTYVAVRSSFGFRGRLWEKGEQVQAKELPNEHFRLISSELEKAQDAAQRAAEVALAAAEKAKTLAAEEEKKSLEKKVEEVTGKKE